MNSPFGMQPKCVETNYNVFSPIASKSMNFSVKYAFIFLAMVIGLPIVRKDKDLYQIKVAFVKF